MLGTMKSNHQAADDRVKMKNRQKSRSGCRTCKLRRLRCDESKPGCRNCAQKGFDCPGYQQRLQWSTKHERPTASKPSGPANFTQLVTAASESIVSKPSSPAEDSAQDGTTGSLVVPVSLDRLAVPSVSPSASTSPWTSASSSSSSCASSPSPPPQYEGSTTSAESHAALVAAVSPSVPAVVPKTEPGVPEEADQAPRFPMFQPVVDIPTFLIEHWFNSVCPSWSALDSPTNPYRRFTLKLWNSSTAVYYSLQAISAASLVERLPHVMKDTARSAPLEAFKAIQEELLAFRDGGRPDFPVELLLSLFCMSSSLCWMESRQLGQKFVRQARKVLRILDNRTLDSEAQELLGFFNGCLVYEEMLRSVVSDEEIDFEHMLSWPEPAPQQLLTPSVAHPWTGVPSDVLRLFGKAVALCRRSRTRWKQNGGTSYRILQGAMKDIEEATKVESSLRSVVISQIPECPPPPQATDRAQELHYLTEAYRLSAFLQLYETFPDLAAKRIPTAKGADGSAAWHSWVSSLALHVMDVLGKVPPGSLSCIQPLLCLCAGSGLRYDSQVPLGTGQHSDRSSTDLNASTVPTPGAANAEVHLSNPDATEKAMEISHARHAIMDRLDQLELCLPPKPIGVAKELMRAVWGAYDEEIGLTRRTHWLDVMSDTGLHSIFG